MAKQVPLHRLRHMAKGRPIRREYRMQDGLQEPLIDSAGECYDATRAFERD